MTERQLTVSYNMEGLLKLSVEKYLDIVGHETKMKKVTTPSLPEETKEHPSSWQGMCNLSLNI